MGQHQSLKTPNQMFLFLELSKRSCETMAIQKSVFEYADPHKFGCLCSLTADCSPGRNHFHLWSQHSQDQAFPAQKHSAHRWHLSHADETQSETQTDHRPRSRRVAAVAATVKPARPGSSATELRRKGPESASRPCDQRFDDRFTVSVPFYRKGVFWGSQKKKKVSSLEMTSMTSIEILKIEGGTPWHANPYAKAAKKDELLGETHAVFGQTHAAVRLAPFSGGQKQARALPSPAQWCSAYPTPSPRKAASAPFSRSGRKGMALADAASTHTFSRWESDKSFEVARLQPDGLVSKLHQTRPS